MILFLWVEGGGEGSDCVAKRGSMDAVAVCVTGTFDYRTEYYIAFSELIGTRIL